MRTSSDASELLFCTFSFPASYDARLFFQNHPFSSYPAFASSAAFHCPETDIRF